MSSDYTKVKVGDAFSRQSFGTVIGFQDNPGGGDKFIQVKNEAGLAWCVSKEVFEKEFSLAGQWTVDAKVPATELATIFVNSKFVAMTVNFNKKVETKDVQKTLLDLYPNKGGKSGFMSKPDFKKLIKEQTAKLLVGEERTMRGYHRGFVDVNGRISFVDLDIPGYNVRLVDPRTINWLVVNGKKWTLKAK